MFPFVAVQGQEKVKKALYLSVINKNIGGVLISGKKGTAKTTLVRGLEDILGGEKVVNLPLNITEDNLSGTLDIEKTLKLGEKTFQAGILKKADDNILYVDEINLLGENIVSKLLEVSALRENIVERDGLSIRHSSSFTLIGTMNSEEGQLRGHFLDKFGLYVEVEGINHLPTRIKVIQERLEYERNPEKFLNKYREKTENLKEILLEARKRVGNVKISEQIIYMAVKLAKEGNVAGNKVELILIETARAIAALGKREYINIEDLKEAAEFVFPHRIRDKENKYETPKNNETENFEENEKNSENSNDNEESRGNQSEKNSKKNENDENNKNEVENKKLERGENQTTDTDKKTNGYDFEENFDIGRIFKVKDVIKSSILDGKKRNGAGKRCKTKTSLLKGKYVKSIKPRGKILDFAFDATLRVAAPYQKFLMKKSNLKIKIEKNHIRVKVRENRIGTTILFVVDSSASMGVKKRMEAVKGAIMSLLKDAYEKRDKIGLVLFRKDKGEEILPITRSVDLAKKKLVDMTTGGKTPLAEGLIKGFNILKSEMKRIKDTVPVMIILTDGKGNFSKFGLNPMKESFKIAEKIRKEKIKTVVVDTEEGFVKLGLGKELAKRLGGEYCKLEELKSEELIKLVKSKR